MSDESPYVTPRNGQTDASVSETAGVVAGAKDLVRETAAEANQKLGAARESIQNSYQAATETVAGAQTMVADKASAAAKVTDTYVNEHPWMAVAAAAAVGVTIGMLTRRK